MPPSQPQPQLGWNFGFIAVALLLAAVAVLVGWQTWSGLEHVQRMMTDRSDTLQRMASTELGNVARYGAARRERLDEVVRDIAASKDVEGVLLEREDGRVRFAHGDLPAQLPDHHGLMVHGKTLLISGPTRIETLGCLEVPAPFVAVAGATVATDVGASSCCTAGLTQPAVHSAHCSREGADQLGAAPGRGPAPTCCSADLQGNGHGCAGGPASGLDGEYRVVLALDATPYQRIQRSVQWQGFAGGLILFALGGALWRHQGQMRRHAKTQQALAIADERARYLERLSLVASGLAHEIKNPIGSLRGFSQLIAEKLSPNSPEAEYAQLMVSELDSMTRRVDGLRQFARPNPPSFQVGHPAEIIRRVVLLLGPDMASRDLHLQLDLPAAPGPEAPIDTDRIRDLVVNLLMNAIEASPEGGNIRIKFLLEKDTDHFCLEVSDEGPGIEPEEREGVFRPFHSTKAAGLGLGLALAQRAVEDHRGHLEIGESSEGALLRAKWPRNPLS